MHTTTHPSNPVTNAAVACVLTYYRVIANARARGDRDSEAAARRTIAAVCWCTSTIAPMSRTGTPSA